MGHMGKIFWLIIGLLSLVLGTIGIFLPLLPTVPFYLLAAFSFSKSSERLHNWLLNHKMFGPDIRNWNENHIIRRPAKLMALGGMAVSVIVTLILAVPIQFIAIQSAFLAGVGMFIWRQKEN